MQEVRRIELRELTPQGWWWVDSASGQRGLVAFADGAEGMVLTVEMRFSRGRWVIVRNLDASDSNPKLADIGPPAAPASAKVAVRQVRSAIVHYSPRSASAADSSFDAKRRPCVVVWCDGDYCGCRFIYSSSGGRRRWGAARRLRQWREAGLFKPSVVAAEIVVVATDQLGPAIGTLSEDDAAWACELSSNDLGG